MKNKLRVGFDLDGVILYNPVRIARPVVAFLKNKFSKKNGLKFFIPRSSLHKQIFRLFHMSSIFLASGFSDLKEMVNAGKIEAYIITARFGFLKQDFEKWLDIMDAKSYFKKYLYNKNDNQPHLFKEKMIEELDLDVFIEDNWDIVNYLKNIKRVKSGQTKIFWIYNILDRNIEYPYKFASLKDTLKLLKSDETGKKKVLLATDYFIPHWTGISKSLLYLTQSLKNTFDFTVLTVRYDEKLKRKETIQGIDVIRENYIFRLSRSYHSVSIIYKFIREIGKQDIVFINSPSSNIFPFALIAKLFRKKVVIFHQGDLILPKGIINRIIEKIFDMSTYLAFALADKVSTYTEDYAKNSRVMKPWLNKFTPLLLPFNLQSQNKKDIKNNKMEKILDFKKRGFAIIGFAGRFVEEKGFDLLFKAIPFVLERNPNIHFFFAGETKMPYENFYEKNAEKLMEVKNYVTFLGLLNDNELSFFYKNLDLIVLPSRSDCFPLVQAEAMMSGTPSVVSDIPGARYLVKKTGFGRIFQKENYHELAKAISEIISKKNIISKNHHQVISVLDIEKNAEKIRKYIES